MQHWCIGVWIFGSIGCHLLDILFGDFHAFYSIVIDDQVNRCQYTRTCKEIRQVQLGDITGLFYKFQLVVAVLVGSHHGVVDSFDKDISIENLVAPALPFAYDGKVELQLPQRYQFDKMIATPIPWTLSLPTVGPSLGQPRLAVYKCRFHIGCDASTCRILVVIFQTLSF